MPTRRVMVRAMKATPSVNSTMMKPTIAAGSWQGARYAARREATAGGCGSGAGCGGCAKICGTQESEAH